MRRRIPVICGDRKGGAAGGIVGVTIAIENVWNRFLLSPLEAVTYVDAFKSPRVRWHFDAGNVANTGWPEQWVRTLGSRIVKVHVKEFSRKLRDEKGPSAGFQVDLFEGDSDWPAVMAALDEVGYAGWMIAEQYRPKESSMTPRGSPILQRKWIRSLPPSHPPCRRIAHETHERHETKQNGDDSDC